MLLLTPYSTLTGWNMIRIMGRKFLARLMILFLLAAWASPAAAQKQASDEELVKQTQNLVADLISVPLQNNFNFGTGSRNRTVWVGNIQPVIPIKLGDDWNLITRTIMPIINQPSLFPGTGSATGLGDINPTFFFSPAKPGELIWGVGPTFNFADRHQLTELGAANLAWVPLGLYSPCKDNGYLGRYYS
jgi:hypothetical protein